MAATMSEANETLSAPRRVQKLNRTASAWTDVLCGRVPGVHFGGLTRLLRPPMLPISVDQHLSGTMSFVLQPWQLLLVILAGWLSRPQQQVIEYLQTEN